MNLFLAMTPAQLLNCIVLKSTVFKNDVSDLYYTEDIKQYAKRIKQYNLFNEEYEYKLIDDITDRSNSFKRGIVRIKNALDIGVIEKTAPSDLKKYDKVFASGISLRNYELYYAVKRRNKAAEIVIYEEGICEYYHFMEKSLAKELFSKIFFNTYYPRDCKEMFVYEPSAVKSKWDNIIIKQIPKFIKKRALLQMLNDIFKYDEKECSIFNEKVIFLESCFYDQESEKKQLDYLNMLIDHFGKDNIVVKMHPRSEKTKYDKELNIVYSHIPFEIVAANMDIEKNAFVSITTSIIINFKLMLGKEPLVICMNRMNKSIRKSEAEMVFDRVQQLYSSNRFLIPVTDDDLTTCISEIKNVQHNEDEF